MSVIAAPCPRSPDFFLRQHGMSDRVSSIPVDPGGDEGPVATQEHGRQEKTSDNSRDASSAEDLISLSRAGLNPQAAAFSCCKQSAKASSPLDTIPVSAVAALEVPVPSATSPPVACRDVMQCCSMQSPPLLADVPALSSSRLSSPRSSTGIGSPRGSEPGSERHAWSSSERTTIPLGDEENLYVLQPKTPPQQSYMRGYRMDSQMMTAGSWDVANSMCASEGMPGALRAALTDAIMRDNVPELVAALDSGLSPDATLQWCPPEGGTASPVERSLLSIASFYGAKDVAAQLLARGANANFASRDDSMTPLHMAAAGNTLYTVEIIRLLLFHGANKESVDKLGRQPVELLPMNCQQRQPLPQQLHMPMLSEMQLKELTFEDTGVVVGPHVPDPTGCSELSDINLPEYCTDEFRMYHFKVLRCSKTRAHDWTECPFVHPGEKARRRSPQKFTYSCSACPDFRKGVCRRGDLCTFSHGVFECWLHPSRYRTQMCKDGPMCTRRVCFFAHSMAELRVVAGSSGMGSPPSPASPSQPMRRQLQGATMSCDSPDIYRAMLPPSYGLQSNARGLPAARLAPTCSPMTQPASECGGIERRHSDIGERPSLVGTWALRRVSMQGEPFWQSPQIDFGSARQQQQLQAKLNADYMQGQHVLREAQQQQQQQVDILLHQQLQRQCTLQQSPQQKLQRAAYSPPTVSCPTSPMGALNIPSGSCPSSAIQSTALGSLSTTQQLSTRSPSNSFQYQIGHGHSQSDIQSTPRQAGPPELPWLQQIKAQDTILESPNMSRVGSLSALDVSWVDDLTGRKDNEDQGLNNSSFQ